MRKLPSQFVAVLSLGVVSQVGQVVLLRELLMVFYGSELAIGGILASWMVWVGVGSWLGGVLGEKVRRPPVVSALAAGGVLVVLPATILLVRVLRGFFDVLPGEYLSLLAAASSCVLLMAPICTLLGAQFVLLSRIWREGAGVLDTSGATKTYVVEALGNAVGGILFTLLLVHFLNSFQSAVLVGMLMLAGTLWLTGGRGAARPVSQLLPVLGGVVVVAAVAFPLLGRLDSWAYRLQWKYFAPDHDLVETRQSKYGTISVVQRGDQYSFFQSGHLAFSTAGVGKNGFELEESAGAVFAHLSMAQHRDPRRVLLIGGGLRGVLREIARHPVEAVDYVELDRVLIEVAQRYVPEATQDVLRSPRVRLVTMDGRLFVKESDSTYDMIIVDVPDPATAVLNRYYTAEFFREASERLHPDGVFVTGVTSTADLRASAVANRNATVYHTLRSVFAHVLAVGDRFCYFFASNSPGQITADPQVLRGRFVDREVETRGFSDWYYYTLLQEAPLRRRNWILRHHGRRPDVHLSPPDSGPLFPGTIAEQEAEEVRLPPVQQRYFINSDFRPIGYYYTLVLWSLLTRTRHANALSWILRVRAWWILPVVGAALVGQLFLRAVARCTGKRADVRYAILFAIFTTGLSAMALQIALLFSFQSVYGFVYEVVGLIVAFFMAGLALGAAVVHRLVRDKANMRALAFVQLLVALCAFGVAFGLPLSAGVGSSRVVFVLFSAITFCGGLLNGADFPLATACCMALNSRAEKSTGLVYGTELLGACLGAALASVVVAPVLGIVACCLLAGIMNATACVIVLLCKRPSWMSKAPTSPA